jgi:glutamyl-tRNA reductase
MVLKLETELLMRVGVIGINHKLADLKLREKLAKACQKWFSAAYSFHREHYFILLSTCNRTEVYFSSDDLPLTHTYLLGILRNEVEEEFDHKLYSYFGVDCFSHLARVTAGLDSAIVAETEIQGQVKSAYEALLDRRQLPKELHFLFQKSLHIAKKVRSGLQLGRGMPNLEHAIFNTGKHFFNSVEDARILFVGASEINRKILSYLKGKNLAHISLCNRSNDSAMAQNLGVHIVNWSELSNWHHYDWIILGTKCPDYLINCKDVSSSVQGQKLIMDLCVPRNVDPKIGRDARFTLLNIDQLNRLLKIRSHYMNHVLMQAETLIFSATHHYSQKYLQRVQKAELRTLIEAS